MLNAGVNPWPFYAEDEVQAVAQVLRSGQVNQWTGGNVKLFEQKFANYIGTDKAVAVMNGTVALDLILKFGPFGSGDQIIVTPRTFLASVSSIINAGLVPVFADVDPVSGNFTPETIAKAITPQTRGILCVHLAGWPCEMDEIMQLARQWNLYVIEDCAQAHGAEYKGRKVGSIGHAAAWSFCQDKIMSTAGEGGMITTNDLVLWRDIWEYKDHGKCYDKMFNTVHPPGFRWVHDSFGSNYRMTEIQAVVGIQQLQKLDYWVAVRNHIASQIDDVATGYSAVRTAKVPEWMKHAKYKHYLYVDPTGLNDGWSRDRIIEELGKLGTPCFQGSCSEVYLEEAFMYFNPEFIPTTKPVAKELGETSLMFLVHPTLGGRDMYETLTNLEKVLLKASRSKCKM
jgi:dTDP-4-amino-4,6-dideoxygalactose transaminase